MQSSPSAASVLFRVTLDRSLTAAARHPSANTHRRNRAATGRAPVCQGATFDEQRQEAACESAAGRGFTPNRLAVVGILLFSVFANAQPAPFRVGVSAPRNWVLSGRTLQLEARGLGQFGERISGIAWTWASSNPVVATVSDTGEVRGRAPGIVQIEASYEGVSGIFDIVVHPLRFEITPARLELETGEEGRFQARAVDADGNPIAASAPVMWTSTLGGIVSVDGGTVRALTPGRVTVSARIALGGGVSFSGQALVLVRRRSDYRFERLIDSSFTFSQVELRNTAQISYAGGRMAFTAALSNGAQGLFLYDGVLRLLAASGQSIAGLPAGNLNSASVNSRGDVAVQFQSLTQGNAVALFRGGSASNASVALSQAGQCCLCCYNMSRDSLGEDGALVFTANDNGRNGLFYRHPDGRTETIPDQVAGLGTISPSWNFVLAAPRRVLFEAAVGPRNGWFLWDGQTVRRVVVTGDAVLGRQVNGIAPQPAVLPNGEAYFVFWGNNFPNSVFRWNGGAWSTVLETRAYGTRAVERIDQLHDASADSVVFQGQVDGLFGLFRLRGAAIEDVAPYGPDRAFNWASQAILADDGSVLVHGNTATVASRITRIAGGASTTLFENGRRIDGSLPISISWEQIGGGDASSRVVRTGSNALLRVAANQAAVVLGPGELLPDGARIVWIGDASVNTRGEWIAQVGTTTDQRVLAWRNGRIETLLRANNTVRLPTGEFVNNIMGRVALNGQGQFVAFVNANGQQRFVLFGGQAGPRVVITPGQPVPGGGTFGWPNQVALDDSGRVLFSNDGPGPQEIFLWENGQTRRLIRTGDRAPAGFVIQSLQTSASGNQLYVTAWEFFNNRQMLRIDGAALRPVLSTGDRLSFGASIQTFMFNGVVKVAPAGDLAMAVGLNTGVGAAVVRGSDGVDRVLAQTGARITTGDWVGEILDVADAGNGVYFVTARALSADSRIVLYRVTPR